MQQQMQTDLPLAYEDAGAAKQHATVTPGSSSNLHHVLEEQAASAELALGQETSSEQGLSAATQRASAEPAVLALGQETLSEQGMSAVTQRASTEQDAPVGQSTHILGKASHQELASAAGQQEHGTEVISRQNSGKGPHGRLRNHSSLVNRANPEQVS